MEDTPPVNRRSERGSVVDADELAILVGAGALAGLVPALKAARVKPAEALRNE